MYSSTGLRNGTVYGADIITHLFSHVLCVYFFSRSQLGLLFADFNPEVRMDALSQLYV